MFGIYAICFGFIIDISIVNGDITDWPPFLGDEQDCPTWTDSHIKSPQVCFLLENNVSQGEACYQIIRHFNAPDTVVYIHMNIHIEC